MKCLIKNLLGFDTYTENKNEICVPLPPIVKSLFASVIFITLMTIVSHMLKA